VASFLSAPFAHLRIILVRPQQSGNIGAVARSIANHGLGRLVLVDPPAFDPERARWMSPHAHHIINTAKIVSSVEDAVADIPFVIGASARERRWGWPVWDVPTMTESILQNSPKGLMFGPEDSGLSNQDLKYCHAIFTLPTHAHQSLNLAQSVNVCGGHLISAISKTTNNNSAPNKELGVRLQNQLATRVMGLLERVHYLQTRNPIHIQNFLLRLTQRANLNENEIKVLLGMASKLHHSDRVMREQLLQTSSDFKS
jgi:tRNA (cytidine32/uridine32-2'-O)-methyltransferase